MKNCPKCHVEVSEKAKFCIKCGFNIKKHEEENAQQKYFCPECGTAFIGGSFCPECGTCINDYLSTPLPIEHPGLEIEGTVLVKYTGKSRYLQIPRGITEIYDSAFENNEVILSVEIPEGVTIIGKKAFAGCRHLQKVTLPSTVEEIYDEAFCSCSELRKIDLPNKITKIRYRTFAYCGFKSINIPQRVTTIGGEAFWNCQNLEKITIQPTVEKIDTRAFDSCTSLKKLTLPSTVKTIANLAFAGCSSLQTIQIQNTEYDGYYSSTFECCKNIKIVYVPKGKIEVIKDKLFRGYTLFRPGFGERAPDPNITFIEY